MIAILLVEDEFALLRVVELCLSDEGYRVFTAGSGLEALEILAQKRIDLVVSDVMLPLQSGQELAHTLGLRPEWAHVRIVLISGVPGYVPPPNVPFLRKPFSLSALVEVVRRVLDR